MTVKIASLFSSTTHGIMPSTATMSSRDHPFNRSTRPLLMDRKPQIVVKKKSFLMGDSKLHGFNDFDIMSQQFKSLNTHMGYPYGSPPSPTVNSNDFTFSDDNNMNFCSSKTTGSGLVQSGPPPPNYQSVYNTNTLNENKDRRRVGDNGAAADGIGQGHGNLVDTGRNRMTNKEQYYAKKQYSRQQQQHQQKNQFDPYAYDETNERENLQNGSNDGGPFIFGVHTANTFVGSNSTVINQMRKYSQDNGKPVLNQSISDTSSSSRGTEKECSLLVKDSTSSTTSTLKKKNKRNRKDKKFNRENRARIKCVLVGDGNVGKTNLIRTYLENRFVSDYIPTASDIYNAEVMVNDSPVHITLCDTAGQDTLDPLRELCYPDSNVFMLCFSTMKPESFQSIKDKWIPKFAKTKAALVLVGTQADLRTDNIMLNKLQMHGEKPISSKEAWDLATSIGAKYIETSSLKQINVKDAFDTAIWDALLPNRLPPTPPLWKKLLCLV